MKTLLAFLLLAASTAFAAFPPSIKQTPLTTTNSTGVPVNGDTAIYNGSDHLWHFGSATGSAITALTGIVTGTGPGSAATSFGSFNSSTLATALTDESGNAGVFPRFNLSGLTAGHIVGWNGTSWTNGPQAAGGVGGNFSTNGSTADATFYHNVEIANGLVVAGAGSIDDLGRFTTAGTTIGGDVTIGNLTGSETTPVTVDAGGTLQRGGAGSTVIRRLTAPVTITDADTETDLTDLTFNVASGRHYILSGFLVFTMSGASTVTFYTDFNGGDATAASFNMCLDLGASNGSGALSSTQSTLDAYADASLTTKFPDEDGNDVPSNGIGSTQGIGTFTFRFTGHLEVGDSGTFIPRITMQTSSPATDETLIVRGGQFTLTESQN